MLAGKWTMILSGAMFLNSCGGSAVDSGLNATEPECKTQKPIHIGVTDPRGPQRYSQETMEISLGNVSFYKAPKSATLKQTKDGRWSTWTSAPFIKNGEYQIDLYRVYLSSGYSSSLMPTSRLGTRLSNGDTFGESISGNATNAVQGIETMIKKDGEVTKYTTMQKDPTGMNKLVVKMKGEYLISYQYTYIESKPVKSAKKDLVSVWTPDHKKKPTTVCLKSATLIKK